MHVILGEAKDLWLCIRSQFIYKQGFFVASAPQNDIDFYYDTVSQAGIHEIPFVTVTLDTGRNLSALGGPV